MKWTPSSTTGDRWPTSVSWTASSRRPRYGERWARPWLDLARYADTNGYIHDRRRNMWLYRDWVIKAINSDLPFDQFTIEQVAGDLLPDATPEQKIATGFHRNTMINTEGGTDAEEYRVAAILDRVETTGTVWLGSTIACAQCHDQQVRSRHPGGVLPDLRLLQQHDGGEQPENEDPAA